MQPERSGDRKPTGRPAGVGTRSASSNIRVLVNAFLLFTAARVLTVPDRALESSAKGSLKPTRQIVHGHYPVHMNAISYTAARENLAATMDRVCVDHDPVIITRKRSQSVVLLSLEDFESLQETAYLLRSPANASRLIESIAELEKSNGIVKKLAELPS